jgi:uncharacterized membrane protein
VFGDLFNQIFALTMWSVIGSLVLGLGTTIAVIGVIVWAVRRSSAPSEDPARAELKRRLATGEISPVEYQARIDALDRAD